MFKDIPSYVEEEKSNLAVKISRLPEPPRLTIIQIGSNSSSNSYIRGKIKDCDEVGIRYEHIRFDELVSYKTVGAKIFQSCLKSSGVILQLPVPRHIQYHYDYILDSIIPEKDVDGFKDNSPFNPCTPKGVIDYLDYCEYDLSGKDVLVIGRSEIVGKPLARMLLDRDATVTIAHSHSHNLEDHIANSDMVFTAIDKIEYFTADYFEDFYGDGIIDIGLGKNSEGKLRGNLAESATMMRHFFGGGSPENHIISGIGGIGLLTRLSLLKNVYDAAKG